MKQIDTRRWSEFLVGDLFDIHPTKAYKLTNNYLFEDDGVNPVVVNSSFNNGIGGYTNQPTTESGNIITFSDTTTATAMFYQEKPFVGYPHVQGIYPIGRFKTQWTKNALLFFLTVFKKRAVSSNIDYVNKFTRELAKEMRIMLPVDKTGQPDFAYMEEYMRNLESSVGSSIMAFKLAKRFDDSYKIDTSQWKEFAIKELFSLKRPAARSQANYNEGYVPFIASGNFNNGVLKYLEPQKGEVLEAGNCITVSPIDGSSFYQECDFLGRGGAGSSIILLYNPNLNLYNGYFIATIIRTVCRKYAYGDMGNKDTIGDEIIKLPVDKTGHPDFAYMERYMRNLEFSTQSSISALQLVLYGNSGVYPEC